VAGRCQPFATSLSGSSSASMRITASAPSPGSRASPSGSRPAATTLAASALYWHVRDKRELLDEMAIEIWRRVSAEVAALPADLPWDRVMAEFAALTRRAIDEPLGRI
jgi:hypothetical protein